MLNTFNLYDIATLIGTTRDKVHFWSSGGTALATDYYLYRPTGKIYYGYAGTMPSAPTTSWSVFYPQKESVRAILKRLAAEAGYTLVTGSFEEMGTVTTVTDALWYQKTGTYYTWGGTLPKTVPAGSTPATTGGIGAGAWVDRTDALLRSKLASSDGASLIGSMSYAQLRAYSGSNTTVNVWGISNVFDGAAGTFKLNASDTTSTDNGGTILVDSVGRRWCRIFKGHIYVEWFGAVGDGVTDDTSAAQQALNASALTKSKTVIMNNSKSGYLISGSITIPLDTALIGNPFQSVSSIQYNASTVVSGNWLIFTGTSSSPIATSSGSTFSGFTIFYKNQTDTNPPVAYPYTVTVPSSTDVTIENIFSVNTYKFLSVAASHARLKINNIRGWFLDSCLDIDGSTDTDHISNIHIIPVWPLNNSAASPSIVYNSANASYLRLKRCDAIQVKDFFCYGGFRPIQFNSGMLAGVTGTTYGQFTNISIDNCSGFGVSVFAFNANGLQFSNLMVNGGGFGNAAFFVNANCANGKIQISNYSCWAVDTAIENSGNCTVNVDNVNAAINMPNNAFILQPQTSGYTATLKLSNLEITNYNGGPLGQDFNFNASSGAHSYVHVNGGTYLAGGKLPTVVKNGYETQLLYQYGNPPASTSVTTPSVPASGVSIANPNPVPCRVAIYGALTGSTYVGGLAIEPAMHVFNIGAYETISITYSVAPTWSWCGI